MTHRVLRKAIRRREDGQTVVYHPGDEFEPSDAELDAFGDNLEHVSGDDATDDDDDDDDDEEDVFAANDIDPDDYSALQSAAADLDDVKGNLPKDELREALREAL